MSVFEIVRGVEGDCLVLDGTRICGSKPWGGGRIIKTFHTDGIYEVIDKDEYHKLEAENAKLRELVYDLLNAWDDIQHEVVTGPTFDECERYAYELGIEVDE